MEKVECSCGGEVRKEVKNGLVGYIHSHPFTKLHEHVFTLPGEGTCRFD